VNEEILVSECVLSIDRHDAATAIVTLNRPEKRNALTIELMEALCHEMSMLAQQPDCRVVVFRGAGIAFCTGLDLSQAADAKTAERSAHLVAKLFETVSESPLVTIAAAHGAAYAGGAGLMSSCDFVVASEDLRVCFPEVRRGLVPALVSTVLRHRLRDTELRELLLLAEPIDARRALALGLVHRVVAADRLLDDALRIGALIKKGAPSAIRHTKQLLRDIRDATGTELFERALNFHVQARLGNEAHEGLAAFHERREPVW
jgi:methylglutaconyl-CoA hydratase